MNARSKSSAKRAASRRRLPVNESQAAVDAHFEGRAPNVRSTYLAILEAARSLGALIEEPKQTSIHLVRSTAFAGVSTRKAWLILTLKSAVDIASPRIKKREQTSANRWHLELRIEEPGQVDRELKKWINAAFDLSA
jgi:hypothetical protein